MLVGVRVGVPVWLPVVPVCADACIVGIVFEIASNRGRVKDDPCRRGLVLNRSEDSMQLQSTDDHDRVAHSDAFQNEPCQIRIPAEDLVLHG
jgi:hypothetical protein